MLKLVILKLVMPSFSYWQFLLANYVLVIDLAGSNCSDAGDTVSMIRFSLQFSLQFSFMLQFPFYDTVLFHDSRLCDTVTTQFPTVQTDPTCETVGSKRFQWNGPILKRDIIPVDTEGGHSRQPSSLSAPQFQATVSLISLISVIQLRYSGGSAMAPLPHDLIYFRLLCLAATAARSEPKSRLRPINLGSLLALSLLLKRILSSFEWIRNEFKTILKWR